MKKQIPAIIFIGLITTALLVFFSYKVAPKPTNIPNTTKTIQLKYENLPLEYELVNHKGLVKKENIFIKNKRNIIAIANLDALVVINQLEKYYKPNFNYITAANISNSSWIIKKMGILPTLEKINKDIKTPMIYDYNGWLVKSLGLKDLNPVKYFIYEISKDGIVKFLFDGEVPMGAIDGNITQDQIKKILDNIMKRLEE